MHKKNIISVAVLSFALLMQAVTPATVYAADPVQPASCRNEEIAMDKAPEATQKEYKALIEANQKYNNSEEGKKSTVKRPTTITKTTCTQNGKSTTTYSIAGSMLGGTDPLPRLFEDPNVPRSEYVSAPAPCSFDGTILECKPSGTVTKNALRLPICELVEQAFVSQKKDARSDLSTYACSELIDPLPANFFKGNTDTQCVQKTVNGDLTSYKITDSKQLSGSEYCTAILSKTDGGFGALFAFVRLVYDISLPILIALAVISLVGLGVFIMYAPNGGEDSMKKAKEMAFRVASGFLLLLLMRVFLSLISFDLFGLASVSAPSSLLSTAAIEQSVSQV